MQNVKRPQWTCHQKWKLTKLGHGGMDLTIKKAFNIIDILLYETQRVLWNQVLMKICHTAGWKNEIGKEQDKPRGQT